MQFRLVASFLCVCIAATVVGCSSTPAPEKISINEKSLTLVVSNPQREVYLQGFGQYGRFAGVRFSEFEESMLESMGVSTNHFPDLWIGYSTAIAAAMLAQGNSSSGDLAQAVFAGAFAALISELAAEKRIRMLEEQVEPQLAVLDKEGMQYQLKQQLANSTSQLRNLDSIEIVDSASLTAPDQEKADFQDYFAGFDTDYVGVLAVFPTFSPNFEVL